MTDIDIPTSARILQQGGLVAFPTETVFGLGADAGNAAAVAGIYRAKGRPAFNPLIVHVADVAAARELTVWDAQAERLAAAFWPGPLTLVLPLAATASIPPNVTAGLVTLAVRVPSHPVAQALLRAFAGPVAAPSANPSGFLSAVRAGHVRAHLGQGIPVLEGECPVGIESTIVQLSANGWSVLRPGTITAEQIQAVLQTPPRLADAGCITAPGQLASHYTPRLPLRIDVKSILDGEALLAFGPAVLPGAAHTINLSPAGDLEEAAHNLYLFLHTLDQPERFSGLAVMPIPTSGIGVAINDRLRRAATPNVF